MHSHQVNGLRMNVLDQGQGPPLLLVHGFPLDHTMWAHQIEQFSKTHRVIAPDLRGFGRSEVTDGTATMRQFADDLNALLDVLRITEPVVLCGLSMGGYIAFQFVQHHRGRLRGLILCDTKAAADSEEGKQTRYKLADLVSRAGTAVLAESMPAKLFAPGAIGSAADESTRNVIRRANPIGVVAAIRGLAARPDVTSVLRLIDVPTLVIVGQHDAITPAAEMKSMAQAIPGAEFVEIAEAGHMAPLESPDAVNAAIENFLRRLSATA